MSSSPSTAPLPPSDAPPPALATVAPAAPVPPHWASPLASVGVCVAFVLLAFTSAATGGARARAAESVKSLQSRVDFLTIVDGRLKPGQAAIWPPSDVPTRELGAMRVIHASWLAEMTEAQRERAAPLTKAEVASLLHESRRALPQARGDLGLLGTAFSFTSAAALLALGVLWAWGRARGEATRALALVDVRAREVRLLLAVELGLGALLLLVAAVSLGLAGGDVTGGLGWWRHALLGGWGLVGAAALLTDALLATRPLVRHLAGASLLQRVDKALASGAAALDAARRYLAQLEAHGAATEVQAAARREVARLEEAYGTAGGARLEALAREAQQRGDYALALRGHGAPEDEVARAEAAARAARDALGAAASVLPGAGRVEGPGRRLQRAAWALAALAGAGTLFSILQAVLWARSVLE